MQTPQKIAIVGSGLVGSLLAIYLKKAGHIVHIYDRSPDIRNINFSGRSINLAMSHRGWKALDGVGVGDEVRSIAIPMDKRAIHRRDKLNFQNYGQEGESIYSISRGTLNRKMIDLAEQAGAEFYFEQKIWDVTLSDATLHIGEEERGEWQELKYDMVFGADGVSPTKAETAALTDGIINEVFTKSSRYASEYVRELVRSANRGVEHRVGYAPYCNSLSDFCGFRFTRKPENKDFIILRDTPDLEDFCFEDHWRMVCGITAPRPKQFRALSWGKKLSKKAGNPGNPKDKWNGELSASILHAPPSWGETRGAYAEASVLLHFYPAVESFSFAAARAMLSGAVVVASPSSQFYDTISHGETGFIANTPDEAAYLASRLAWEPHLQAKIAHDAHKWVVAKGPANADVCLNWWKPIICRTT